METITLQGLIDILKQFGLPGAVLFMWWLSDKSHSKTLTAYRDDTIVQMAALREYMAEIRQMYKNNVHLLEAHEALSKDLKDVIIMNTEAMTQVCDVVKTNQFCPQVRLKKQAEGIVQ